MKIDWVNLCSHQYKVVVATRSLRKRVIVVNYVSSGNQTSTVQQPENTQETAQRSKRDHTRLYEILNKINKATKEEKKGGSR